MNVKKTKFNKLQLVQRRRLIWHPLPTQFCTVTAPSASDQSKLSVMSYCFYMLAKLCSTRGEKFYSKRNCHVERIILYMYI